MAPDETKPSRRPLIILVAVVVIAFAGSYAARRLTAPAGPAAAPGAAGRCARIVSLAPSLTETLFALGLGPRVVGVTRYCDYPPEALRIEKVGGYYDPNYEAILALEPDLVALLTDDPEPRSYLESLGVRVMGVSHRSVDGILDSITALGRACGVEERARAMRRDLEERVARVRMKVAGLPRVRTLVAVGRTPETLKEVFISGSDGFFEEMIRLAGGENAYRGKTIHLPAVSGEGILRLDPEAIVDLIPALAGSGLTVEDAKAAWKRELPEVAAVKNDRVTVIAEPYAVIPGPRFILTLEKLARAIHPEAKWDD